MGVFFKIFFIQTIVTAYVFWRGWQILPNRKWVHTSYTSIFASQFLIYLFGFFAYTHLSQDVMYPIACLGTSWAVMMTAMAIALAGYDVLYFLDRKQKLLSSKIDLSSKKLKTYYFTLALTCIISIMGYGYYKFRHPVVTELNIQIDKKAGNVAKMRIAVISDLHLGTIINKEIFGMYVDKIMEQHPDMILMVGDQIDYHLQPVTEQRMEEEFSRLKAPYGVYMVAGNHDYIEIEREGEDAKIKWLDQLPDIMLLRDSALLVSDAFYIVGREDERIDHRKPLDVIMAEVDRNMLVIILNHQPHNLKEDADSGADIALYGHTHNGQLFPYNLFINMIYEVGYGYKKKGNTHIYVTSGLGLSGPQYRIGTSSEILMLNVNFSE